MNSIPYSLRVRSTYVHVFLIHRLQHKRCHFQTTVSLISCSQLPPQITNHIINEKKCYFSVLSSFAGHPAEPLYSVPPLPNCGTGSMRGDGGLIGVNETSNSFPWLLTFIFFRWHWRSLIQTTWWIWNEAAITMEIWCDRLRYGLSSSTFILQGRLFTWPSAWRPKTCVWA